MILQNGIKVALWLASGLALASPGVVDDYDCHQGGPDDSYHCHGSTDAAKQSHLLIGANFSFDSWHYSNGPLNLFVGPGVSAEIAHDFFAGYGAWSFQPHYTGDSGYNLSGWETGLKVGPGIARIGLHPYAKVSYFSQRYELVDGRQFDLSGYQLGMGAVQNFKRLSFDFSLNYRDPRSAQAIWQELGAPGLTAHLHSQLTAAFRF